MKLQFEKVVHVVDSEIVKAMINRESYGFNTFAANRIGGIQTATAKSEWMWFPGKPHINFAELATRGTDPAELESTLWQCGPEFVRLPESSWPTKSQVCNNLSLPEMKQKFVGEIDPQSVLSRFSKWKLLIHATARVLQLCQRFKKDGIVRLETNVDLKKAENMRVLEAQKQLSPE